MKIVSFIAVAIFVAIAAQAQPTFQERLQRISSPPPPSAFPPPASPSSGAPVSEPVNYLIRVEWKGGPDGPKFLELTTAEGAFQLDTIQKNSVKINDHDVPITLKFNGSLAPLNDNKGRLQLFLGRTVPYVTGTMGNNMSTYSQMSVGLDSTFIVTFDKPLVIQNDENGEISVLVKRLAD